MKICLIGTAAQSTINFRETFIKLLINNGHEVFVFASDLSTKSQKKIISLGATPIKYQLNRSGINPLGDIKTIISLKKEIKEISPDIVFSYFSKPTIYGTIAAKICKVPRIVAMLEGLGYAFTPDSVTNKKSLKIFKKKIIKATQVLLYKFSFKYLDKLIFLNKDDPIDLLEKNSLRVKKISILGGIGVQLDKFTPTTPPTDKIRFIFIARLLAEKGIFEFINAAKIIKPIYPEVELIVLGDTDPGNPNSLDPKELKKLISENLIVYPGYVEDIRPWLENSSVFVLPSYYREGIPKSTQEAMACGRAIITTNLPGCRETIQDGFNGYLCSPFSAENLAEVMERFIKNKPLIHTMGLNSRNYANLKFNSIIQDEKMMSAVLND